MYATTLAGTRHAFPDLKSVLATATPARSGDVLAREFSRSGVILASTGTVRRAPKGWGEKLCL